MKLNILILSGFVLFLASSPAAFGETKKLGVQGSQASAVATNKIQNQDQAGLKLQDSNLSEAERERLRLEQEEQTRLRLGSEDTKGTKALSNEAETEAKARLRIEEEEENKAEGDIAEESAEASKSDTRSRFGVNRQLHMRGASQMRGR